MTVAVLMVLAGVLVVEMTVSAVRENHEWKRSE